MHINIFSHSEGFCLVLLNFSIVHSVSSYSSIVLYIRDHVELGFPANGITLKPFSLQLGIIG